ncbi:MAG: porin [Ottowia sp.]|nr:porin [Ottowia sp.]
MKKSLIALAVLGASGLAAAQSSVTLYGVADAGIGRIKTPVLTGNVDPVSGVHVQDIGPGGLMWDKKTRFISDSMMNNGTSTIGLTGEEDIGGGNKVGFQFETGINLEDGSDTNGDEYDLGGFWGSANVYMTGNWGTLKLGRQSTVTNMTEEAYELTGLAGYSVVRNTYRASGFVSNADAAISYATPSLGGFTVAAAFVLKHNLNALYGDGTSPAPFAKNVWDLGVMYESDALGIGASVNKGLDGGKTNYQVGAKYSFGDYAVAASYHHGTTDGFERADPWFPVVPDRVRRGFSIGGQASFGAFTVTLDVTRDTRNEWSGAWDQSGTIWTPKKYTNVLLEGKYELSKRTFFYGAVLRLDGNTNWGLGIQHQF